MFCQLYEFLEDDIKTHRNVESLLFCFHYSKG